MSKEYIERGRLISTLKDNRPLNWTNTNDEVVEQVCYDDFESIVKNQPTADVQEVRHGKWIPIKGRFFSSTDGRGGNVVKCSVCGETSSGRLSTPYCSICGAKMDEE